MDKSPFFHTILLNHAARYPAWQPHDVYKLAHQAALGSEHAVVDRERAHAWLQQELAGLTGECDEPLIDPISEDGAIVRVHLRPLIHLNLTPALLLEAFLHTAEEYRGTTRMLEEYLSTAIALAASAQLGIDAAPLTALVEEMHHAGFPAAHHSEAYTSAYLPAYRVVLLATLPEYFRHQ